MLGWGLSAVGGVLSSAIVYSGPILLAVTESAWDSLAQEVPGMVILAIFGTGLIRYLGGKIDRLSSAIGELVTATAVMQESAKHNCKWQPPRDSHDTGEV